MNIIVTGANGFIGRNLVAWLEREQECHVTGFDLPEGTDELAGKLSKADFVFHLAGVNRPPSADDFQTGNVDLTAVLCDNLATLGRAVPVVLASSIQATLDNPYGASKRQAEEVVSRYAAQTGARVMIYRLKNVFGKWCRPNYNSVVATFCHNIAHDLPITISDPDRELDLVYIDDVMDCFRREITGPASPGAQYREVGISHQVALGRLAELIRSFRHSRQTLLAPDFSDPFIRKLYATYLSYVEPENLAYSLDQKCDARGSLAEFIKTPPIGQIFISRTVPGVTRGNHFHHTKTEKFLVLEGQAVIRLRHVQSGHVVEHAVRGEEFKVVDIPPGYTHSIQNTGTADLVTLFWASELFNPERPDTLALPVLLAGTTL
jgi:UDP-2-acetamido-2,6-beta-L-arabino-hexul-4-ose reductase